MFRCIQYQRVWNMPKACPYAMALSFWEIWWTFYQENILLSGVFRRETASGFYPWGKVDSPRKRVAEGLCGWRHGNSFPMTQSAQSHRQMRSIPLCPKAVFYVFVFDSIHDSATMHNLYPRVFPLNQNCKAIERSLVIAMHTQYEPRRGSVVVSNFTQNNAIVLTSLTS